MLLIVRRERLEAGLTITELAKEVRVSPSQLSQVELGERRPSAQLRKRLAAFYDMPEIELFRDIDHAHRVLRALGGERTPSEETNGRGNAAAR